MDIKKFHQTIYITLDYYNGRMTLAYKNKSLITSDYSVCVTIDSGVTCYLRGSDYLTIIIIIFNINIISTKYWLMNLDKKENRSYPSSVLE